MLRLSESPDGYYGAERSGRGRASLDVLLMLYEHERHELLRQQPWHASAARAAIERIVRDAYDTLDRNRFWPAHPLDGSADGKTMLYFGAAGVIWRSSILRVSVPPDAAASLPARCQISLPGTA